MTLHANVRKLLAAVPRDLREAERPLTDLSRFLVALGVALDSVANRLPLVFTEGQVVRWRERTHEDERLSHLELERLAMQAQTLAQQGLGLTSRAHLDAYLGRVRALLDHLEAELVERPSSEARAKSVA